MDDQTQAFMLTNPNVYQSFLNGDLYEVAYRILFII